MTAGELRHAEDHMLLLGRKTAMERVATFLLEMDRRLAVAGMMALPMCRRDIGDYLGLTLETVSRALSQLHEPGRSRVFRRPPDRAAQPPATARDGSIGSDAGAPPGMQRDACSKSLAPCCFCSGAAKEPFGRVDA